MLAGVADSRWLLSENDGAKLTRESSMAAGLVGREKQQEKLTGMQGQRAVKTAGKLQIGEGRRDRRRGLGSGCNWLKTPGIVAARRNRQEGREEEG